MSARVKRKVDDNILTSEDQPAIKVKVSDDFVYLGRLEFVLYSVAEVELFVFVNADAQHRVSGMFIAQFEGYLDSNAHVYNYPAAKLVKLHSHEFILDTFVYTIAQDMENPESDSARTLNFVLENGYILPREAISSRFVRLLEGRRRELLFSHMADLGYLGVRATEISKDFQLLPEYAGLAEVQLENALAAFEIIED